MHPVFLSIFSTGSMSSFSCIFVCIDIFQYSSTYKFWKLQHLCIHRVNVKSVVLISSLSYGNFLPPTQEEQLFEQKLEHAQSSSAHTSTATYIQLSKWYQSQCRCHIKFVWTSHQRSPARGNQMLLAGNITAGTSRKH
jgi:hypothetical protein